MRPRLLAAAVTSVVLSALGWLGQLLVLADPPVTAALPPVVPIAAPVAVATPAPAPVADPATPHADSEWTAATAARAGLPERALAAYADAVIAAPPACGLGWATLAGVGWVESQHGTIGGRTLGADGRPSAPVLGPALDGVGPVAALRSSAEGTALHGDPAWDHAVGPMQFIPSTWATSARDGDGDGVADPHDLDDAAAAAAAYLCGTGQDLSTGAGWSAAVHAYNHSDAYVAAVHAAAVTYAARAG